MSTLYIVVEGETEEVFVKRILAPYLALRGVYAHPIVVHGGSSYAPYRTKLRNTMRSMPEAHATTLFDFYGRPKDTPGNGPGVSPEALCLAMIADLKEVLGAGWSHPWRFLPYVQQYEFEALLFVEPERTAQVVKPNDLKFATDLRSARDRCATPEDINDSPLTAPSKRLGPTYRKVAMSATALEDVPLDTLRAACPRFDAWVSSLEALGTPP